MHIPVDCESTTTWPRLIVLLPLMGVWITMTARHRVNKSRLVVSCLALIAASALVSHCHSGAGSAPVIRSASQLEHAKLSAEVTIVEQLLEASRTLPPKATAFAVSSS
jgi:hypothetical protein